MEEMENVQEELEEQAPSEEEDVKEEPSEEDVNEPEQPVNEADEDGVPWKNRAMEYQRKYEKTLEEMAKKAQAPVEEELKEPDIQPIKLSSYSEEEWEEAEQQTGMDRKQIVATHNMQVQNQKRMYKQMVEPIKRKLEQYEYKGKKQEAIENMGEEYPDIDEYSSVISKKLDKMKINRSDPEEFKEAIDMVYYSIKGRENNKRKAKTKSRRDKEKERMSKEQPEPTTPPGKGGGSSRKITWNEDEETIRQKMKISVEDWAKNRKK